MERNTQFALRVMVVDDSAVVRQVMTTVLSQCGFEVTVAADPLIAIQKMAKHRPEVIVLDLEMPRMDGLTFLRKLMSEDPLPVLVCSGHAGRGTEKAIRALEEGAVDIITKPKIGVRGYLEESAVLLEDAVRGAARARVKRRRSPVQQPLAKLSADVVLTRTFKIPPRGTGRTVVAVGASTGGTEALAEFLRLMPNDCPGIVIVQHMPGGFTQAFAKRLNQLCSIEVKEARTGDQILPGRALVAPGDRHTVVRARGSDCFAEVMDGPLVSRHRPSVDVLFRSVAQTAGPNSIGVIMTGMGDDGAQGLLEMKQAGAVTIAQEETTCVVFGMPREAIARGAVDHVIALPRIRETLLRVAAHAGNLARPAFVP